MTSEPVGLERAIELIEKFEGIETEAYLDPIGVPTICAGLTRYPNGSPVRLGDVCSREACRGYLEQSLREEVVPALERVPGWSWMTADQRAVLVSFAWNLGSHFYGAPGFESITKVLREGATNPTSYQRMPQVLDLYVNAGGRPLPGLVNRRREEGLIWSRATNPVIHFEALNDTVLKAAPIDRSLLSALGLQSISKGEVVAVSKVEEIPSDTHVWLTLAGSGKRWAAFGPHWATEGSAHSAANDDPDNPPAAPRPAEQIDWSDFNAKAGRFISVGELLQFDKRRTPARGSQTEKNLIELCKQFDAIRLAWKGPIGVTSGYRPEPINSQVGGVPGSRHVSGQALDIYPIHGSIEKFHDWLVQRWSGGYGDGRAKGFIHIDTRNNGMFHYQGGVNPVAFWDY